MQLKVRRAKQVDTDRRGNIKDVYYSLSFSLQMPSEERSSLEQNGLLYEVIFHSTNRTVLAKELIGGEATWSHLELQLALSIQNSMLENCRGFAKLARTAMTFEGEYVLDLADA
jgi:hypothetical protein